MTDEEILASLISGDVSLDSMGLTIVPITRAQPRCTRCGWGGGWHGETTQDERIEAAFQHWARCPEGEGLRRVRWAKTTRTNGLIHAFLTMRGSGTLSDVEAMCGGFYRLGFGTGNHHPACVKAVERHTERLRSSPGQDFIAKSDGVKP